MPNQGKNVSFQYGTQNNYDNLTTKDSNTFYITSDTKRIYLGKDLYNMPNCVIPVSYYKGESLLYQGFCEYGGNFDATHIYDVEPGHKLVGWIDIHGNPNPRFTFTNVYSPLTLSAVETDETISDTWEQIVENITNNTYKQKYKVGDTKALTINNNRIIMQIAAFDTDILAADNTKTAPITWISRNTLPSPMAMSENITEQKPIDPEYPNWKETCSIYKGWNESDLKNYLETDLLNMLPDVLQNNIIPVKKYTQIIENNDGVQNSSTKITEISTNTIWIPSKYEIYHNYSLEWDTYNDQPMHSALYNELLASGENEGCYYPYSTAWYRGSDVILSIPFFYDSEKDWWLRTSARINQAKA